MSFLPDSSAFIERAERAFKRILLFVRLESRGSDSPKTGIKKEKQELPDLLEKSLYKVLCVNGVVTKVLIHCSASGLPSRELDIVFLHLLKEAFFPGILMASLTKE